MLSTEYKTSGVQRFAEAFPSLFEIRRSKRQDGGTPGLASASTIQAGLLNFINCRRTLAHSFLTFFLFTSQHRPSFDLLVILNYRNNKILN